METRVNGVTRVESPGPTSQWALSPDAKASGINEFRGRASARVPWHREGENGRKWNDKWTPRGESDAMQTVRGELGSRPRSRMRIQREPRETIEVRCLPAKF